MFCTKGALISNQNEELVRASLDAYCRGDFKVSLSVFAPNVELVNDSAAPGLGTTIHGRKGLVDLFSQIGEVQRDHRLVPEGIIDAGGSRVVAAICESAGGQSSGLEVDRRIGAVFTVHNERIVRVEVYPEPIQAFEAVGFPANAIGAKGPEQRKGHELPEREGGTGPSLLTRTEEWARFVKRAAYIRGNPRFDAEERNRRLEFARRAGAVLDAAEQGGPLRPSVEALCLLLSVLGSPLSADDPDWLRAWANSDEASLRRALLAFRAPGESANMRFVRFLQGAETAERANVDWRPNRPVGSGSLFNFAVEPSKRLLRIGSLFNFAVETDSLPIVRPLMYERLEQALGHEPRPQAPLAEEYEHHLAFARELQAELQRAGVHVRDMLDTQGLISTSNAIRDFWKWDPPDGDAMATARQGVPNGNRRDRSAYLSVCSCLGYDAPYLLEWIEFHRLVGVERFFLYNNGDREVQRELLAPYVDDGIVVLHDLPIFPPEMPAREHCIQNHREDARWIAFIDTDEFLFSPTGLPLAEVLAKYEPWPAVCANWALFGTSGHRKKPSGLVSESYVHSVPDRHFQSIVDPARVVAPDGPHAFTYQAGLAVDENFYPFNHWPVYVSFSRLRINHYHTKSEEEYRAKCARPRADGGPPRGEVAFDRMVRRLARYGREDRAILTYVPELHRALARTPARIAAGRGLE
jgi:ketosteroid isomerase-like protein